MSNLPRKDVLATVNAIEEYLKIIDRRNKDSEDILLSEGSTYSLIELEEARKRVNMEIKNLKQHLVWIRGYNG